MTTAGSRVGGMGPLTDGQSIAIIGAGPGGIGSALTLSREAEKRGIRLDIKLFEGKRFGEHYNQCAGVLSPPFIEILERDYGIRLPSELIQRRIQGYVLHAGEQEVLLCENEFGGASVAVRRVELDSFLRHCAEKRGIQIMETRVTDLEFRPDEVILFTWGGTFRAAAVMGAFGLSRAMTATMARRTPYRPPRTLETMVTRLYPSGRTGRHISGLLGDCIHVLLPPLRRIEFGALIPKADHITAIIAGRRLRTDDMDSFLEIPCISRLIPCRPDPECYFKGRFPVSLARRPFGDRYVTIGDAAGLVRPFKGKGINSAFITGGLAAKTMIDLGISSEAFRYFYNRCWHITGDLWYGKLMRMVAYLVSHGFSMDPILNRASADGNLREILFDSVSGKESYRTIIRQKGSLGLAMRLLLLLLSDRLRRLIG